jgi:predicted ATPase
MSGVRTLELPSWEAVKLAVADGNGIAAISRFALDLELKTGTLAVLDVPRWRLARTVAIVTAREVPLTPPAERFVALLRETFAADEERLPPNSNLPAAPTPLVGRERELSEVRAQLDTSRVVTLTGPGGSGKTRLALAAAARLIDVFADGVFLVELAPLRDPELVERAIADVVGAGDEPLEQALADRRTLVVLDNFEHLAGAARVVSRLVARTEHVRLLVTSRTPLRIRAEARYAVEPLPDADAVQLFVERALAADPRFEADAAVPAICERLDRLPLAIELAAARVVAFSPAELLERLERPLPVLVGAARDLPERQRTHRRAIEWSRELLSAHDADGFERLAVFRGGWTAEAARAIGVDERSLAELVESSLVQRIDERYAMLETIRELAHERFEARGDVERLRRRHARQVHAFAEEARMHARGPDEPTWLARTAAELDNIRAALDWCLVRGDATLGLAIAGALEPFWYRRARYREGLGRLEPLLELDGKTPTGVRARALASAGRLASELGDARRARRWFDEALPLARKARDRESEAWVLHGLGSVAALEGDRALAKELLEASLARFLELGQHAPAGGRLSYLGELAYADDDLEATRSYYERSVEEYEKAGDEGGALGSTEGLALVAFEQGDLDDAAVLFERGLVATSPAELVYFLAGSAAVAARRGDRAQAATLLGAVEALESELETTPVATIRPRYVEAIGEPDSAGRELRADEAVALARELLERGE